MYEIYVAGLAQRMCAMAFEHRFGGYANMDSFLEDLRWMAVGENMPESSWENNIEGMPIFSIYEPASIKSSSTMSSISTPPSNNHISAGYLVGKIQHNVAQQRAVRGDFETMDGGVVSPNPCRQHTPKLYTGLTGLQSYTYCAACGKKESEW